MSARRGQVLPAVPREVLPITSTLLRSGTPCPRLTSLDKLTQGSPPQDPSLTDLRDGTDAMTHRNAVSRPRHPSKQGNDVGLSQEQTPPSPASHWTGMPRQPLHDAQRRVPLHMTCQSQCTPSTVPAKQAPPHPTIDVDNTDAAPLPTPGCRLTESQHLLTQPDCHPPPSGPAHGRPAAYACSEGSSAVPGHAR